MITANRLPRSTQVQDILREIETRRNFLAAEVRRRQAYLEAVPDCRSRQQLERAIVADGAAAEALEDIEQAIRSHEI